MNILRQFSFIISSFLLATCVACSPKAGSQLFLAEAGATQFGPQQKYVVFQVPSAGDTDDQEFFRMSQLYGSSDLTNRLARLIAQSESDEVRIVVGGPSSEKTRYVVLDALKRNRGRTLGGLMIVFVGDEVDALAVQQIAHPMLATVYFSQG